LQAYRVVEIFVRLDILFSLEFYLTSKLIQFKRFGIVFYSFAKRLGCFRLLVDFEIGGREGNPGVDDFRAVFSGTGETQHGFLVIAGLGCDFTEQIIAGTLGFFFTGQLYRNRLGLVITAQAEQCSCFADPGSARTRITGDDRIVVYQGLFIITLLINVIRDPEQDIEVFRMVFDDHLEFHQPVVSKTRLDISASQQVTQFHIVFMLFEAIFCTTYCTDGVGEFETETCTDQVRLNFLGLLLKHFVDQGACVEELTKLEIRLYLELNGLVTVRIDFRELAEFADGPRVVFLVKQAHGEQVSSVCIVRCDLEQTL